MTLEEKREIDNVVCNITQRIPTEEVILFGSYAYGAQTGEFVNEIIK